MEYNSIKNLKKSKGHKNHNFGFAHFTPEEMLQAFHFTLGDALYSVFIRCFIKCKVLISVMTVRIL